MHVKFTFFGWLTLYFWPLWGNGRIINPSTTCPGVSSTFLWSFNSSSWNLCECTSRLLFWVINPLFLTHLGYVESSTTPRPVPVSHLRGFSISSPQLWNLLPVDIRTLYEEPHLFRKRLKTHLMQQSIFHHWGFMSPVRHLLLLLLLLLSTFLWSFNSSSWKLCECTSNSHFLGD